MARGANDMNRPAKDRPATDQAARAAAMFWIVLQYFSRLNCLENLTQGYVLFDHLLMRMLADADILDSRLRANPLQPFVVPCMLWHEGISRS